MTFQLAEALYYLEALLPEDLAKLGPVPADAVDRESALRAFAPALTGRPPLDRESAWRVAALEIAREIKNGRLTPYDGAAFLTNRVYHAAWQPVDLTTYYHFAMDWEDAAEYEDTEERRRATEAEIHAEADQWLAAGGPPAV